MSIKFQLTGRIDDTQFDNGKYRYLLVTPAPDAYSQPSSYKLQSDNQLGQIGQEITVDVEMSGFVRKKPYEDKQTRQPKIYWEDNVIFRATPAVARPQAVTKAS